MGKLRWIVTGLLLLMTIVIVGKYEEHLFESIQRAKVLSPISKTPSLSGTEIQHQYIEKSSIFSPYWATQKVDETYDQVLYFGVAPGDSGLDTEEAGYKNLSSFISANADRRKLLVLRMIDSEQNFDIIENKNRSRQVIRETIVLAKERNFSGVVLNLEVKALPFDSVVQNISQFVKSMHTEAEKNDLHFAVTLYGDTFYRVRPFDTKVIAESADEVMIMAYDFSKAGGNPGPNFPFSGKETYGYDFQTMMDQFLENIPPEKITVIFGMYGYDWPVNEKGQATSVGSPLTNNQINQKFLSGCTYKNCQVKRDPVSQETTISYTDEKNTTRIVWFEDQESVAKKKAFLKTRGIGSISYWASSYF